VLGSKLRHSSGRLGCSHTCISSGCPSKWQCCAWNWVTAVSFTILAVYLSQATLQSEVRNPQDEMPTCS